MIFSVVTPSFNCKDFILENVQSVRNQGMTAEQLDQVCRVVTDPRIVLRSHFTYSTVGFRPLE